MADDNDQHEQHEQPPMARSGDRPKAEEIDLNEEEEAALDRAWERLRRENVLRERQGVGNGGKAEDEEA